MTDRGSPDSIIIDLGSQALCLEDALATGSDRALLHAFEAVARARGLSQLALDAGLDRRTLADMLGGKPPNMAALKLVVAGLIAHWELASQDALSGISEKEDLESGETDPTATRNNQPR